MCILYCSKSKDKALGLFSSEALTLDGRQNCEISHLHLRKTYRWFQHIIFRKVLKTLRHWKIEICTRIYLNVDFCIVPGSIMYLAEHEQRS
jgi:hypothetical protein